MALRIRVMPGRAFCRCLLPVFSDGMKGGQILLREEYCCLPAGHDGPHRSPSGGWLNNDAGTQRLLERGKI